MRAKTIANRPIGDRPVVGLRGHPTGGVAFLGTVVDDPVVVLVLGEEGAAEEGGGCVLRLPGRPGPDGGVGDCEVREVGVPRCGVKEGYV